MSRLAGELTSPEVLQNRTKQERLRISDKSDTSETKLENGNGNVDGKGKAMGCEMEKSIL